MSLIYQGHSLQGFQSATNFYEDFKWTGFQGIRIRPHEAFHEMDDYVYFNKSDMTLTCSYELAYKIAIHTNPIGFDRGVEYALELARRRIHHKIDYIWKNGKNQLMKSWVQSLERLGETGRGFVSLSELLFSE
jgi:hypothetical protein